MATPLGDRCHFHLFDSHLTLAASVTASHSVFVCHRYHKNGANASWVDLSVRPFYEQYIFPKLTANQSAVLVPGAFASDVR